MALNGLRNENTLYALDYVKSRSTQEEKRSEMRGDSGKPVRTRDISGFQR